jgi:hypothetical protein
MLSKNPERLTDSYQRYLYHRHIDGDLYERHKSVLPNFSGEASSCVSLLKIVPVVCRFARRTITSSTTLKSSVDNTSPCLSGFKGFGTVVLYLNATRHNSERCFGIRRINFVGKLSSDIPT